MDIQNLTKRQLFTYVFNMKASTKNYYYQNISITDLKQMAHKKANNSHSFSNLIYF